MNKIENGKKRKGFKQRKMKSPMLISLFSFAVCLVMLSSCCYAWFTAAQGAKINIEAGTFGVKAVVSNSVALVSQSDVVVGDSVTWIEVEAVGSESAIVLIKNGGTYQVSLTAIGEASKGFCKVTVTVKDTVGQKMGETVYHTGTILNGETFNFVLESTGGGTTEITIQPSWGEYQEESGVGSTLIPSKIEVEGEIEAPVENIAEIASEEEITEAVETITEIETTTEAAETPTEEAETTTEEAETTTEVETSTEVETTTVAETTAEENFETVETTDAESSAEAEPTVNATVEATTETVETVVDTTEADTTEAVETAETTAEAATGSLSAEE